VARLVLNRPIEVNLFSRAATLVLLESEPLELANLLAVRQPVAGARLVLAGVFPNLATGQQVIVTGARLADGGTQSEAVLVAAAQTDAATDLTTVTIRPPLAGVYSRSATSLLANVARATHGETVADEVLGSGDGAPWQSFTLASSPLTYLLATGADDAPVESTLRVTVNGVVWHEVANLGAAAPGDRVYATSQDQAGATTVHFGDQTARPPTGQNNVHAHYRFGIGRAGALAADTLVQLVDSVPGLQAVTNPQPTGGAADPESRDEIRAKAPAGASTFGRAVSPADYAALALAYPGVSAARASWVRIDSTGVLPRPELRITLVGPHRTALSTETITMLRRYLDERRDVNVPLRLVSFTPAYVDVVARIDVNDNYGRQATLRGAQAALAADPAPNGTVGLFGRISFGESVPLSSVYAALQAVPGVKSAVVTTLRDPAVDPVGTVRDLIPVAAGQLAVIGDDPADRDNKKGRLTIQLGAGGFAD
jgi:predicted phage baseplate assembly protein